MNPNRKVQTFHINVKGHYMLPVPAFLDLFYCFEVGDNGQDHTHVGLRTVNPISKNQLIAFLKENLLEPCEPEVSVHQTFDTVIGYHYGLGDKPACVPDPAWISRDFSFRDFVKNKVCHRSNSTKKVAVENKLLIDTNLKSLVDEGIVKLINLPKIQLAKVLYESLVEDSRRTLPSFLPNTWNLLLPVDLGRKKCHYWFYSKGYNKGKTSHRKQWASEYRFQINPYSESRWELPSESIEGIIFDPYSGKDTRLSFDLLEGLCDGDGFRMNIKFGVLYTLNRKLLIVILCNDSIQEAYPIKYPMLCERFNEICLD